MHSVKMTSDQKFWKFIFEDDLDFYEKYTINLLDEDQKHFFDDNPDFMLDYPVSRSMVYLLKDPVYRRLLRKIKEYEEDNEVEDQKKYR